jgi:rod shape determining protein RodA
MKVGLILFLAKYYHRVSIENVNKIKFLFFPIFALIAPVLLVITQPDLGTSLLIAAGGIVVAWLAGVRAKFFSYALLLFIALLPIAISFLKPYQKSRILTFLNPEKDPLGAGYQIIQSKIAIGSGGLFGKGFLNGSQSYLDYLPEKHTDFIFTLFTEEFGFFGSIFILLLYGIIISRIIKIGNVTRSNFGKLYCFSFATAFFIYVTVNMSMVLGLLPIVGSPLPIMSYGGSSMMAIMLGLGIVMSCKLYKDSPVN